MVTSTDGPESEGEAGEEARVVGERLKQARAAADLTQAQAAKRAGFHKQSVIRWEAGTRNIGAVDLAKLARVYGTTAGAILGELGYQMATGEAGSTDAPTGSAGASDDAIAAAHEAGVWRGRQWALLDIMEHVADLQEKAAAMQAKAIRTHREIISHTSPTPVPESVLRQSALDHAREKQERGTARSKRAHGDPHGRAEGA